ncbi:acyltransferase family protein [Bradyrhizobium sp.]|uniref:acyltransferase family protein n=1 Tax=Bradyrhizobium sp. TaxID=376 RepID=UPI0025C5C4BC|nr:acyltransferase [Bradyrhizobium sp.]MBV8922057.1 acyltransferase [Bradyrhizobium sp.]
MTLVAQAVISGRAAASAATERRQYRTLDGLRGVAALSIVILHTPHFFNQWHLSDSFLAVDLFFVLSGFVLAAAYEPKLQAGMTALSFLRIRLIRLYPLYLLGTLFGVPVALMAMKFGGNGLSVDWSAGLFAISLPLSLVMLPMPAGGADGFLYPFNPVLWTIFFEIVVNCLYALLARSLRRSESLAVLVGVSALVLGGLGILQYGTLEGGSTWFTFALGLSRMMFSFFCGVLIFRFRWPGKIRSSLATVALLAALLVLLGVPHSNLSALATILFLFPMLVLTASSVEPGPTLQRSFGLLGGASYAVYALHKPLYQILLGFLIVASPVRPQSMAPWIGIVYVGLMFGLCVLVDRIYDAPARELLRRLLARGEQVAKPAE